MLGRCISEEKLETTGFSYTLSLISGKYKMVILYTLMEFGIVRNNIYRVQVSKISGPGTVKPDPRNPEYLKAIIYVRKWREVTHPVIPV